MGIFMKFDGIDGDSVDAGHSKWIDILSMSHEATRPSVEPGEGRARGRLEQNDISIFASADSAAPKLADLAELGKVVPTVDIEFTRGAGRPTYYRYKLTNVIITSYDVSGSADEGVNISLNLAYQRLLGTFTKLDARGAPAGNTEFTWSRV